MSRMRVDVEEVVPAPEAEDLIASIVDFPKGGETFPVGSFEVVGWAVGRSARVTHVELVEDGAVAARAAMRVDREDVAQLHAGSPQGAEVSFVLQTPGLPPGPHLLTLRARLENGAAAEIATLSVSAVPRTPAVGLVLLYHRIVDLPSEPWSLSVAPRHFAEQMEVLRAEATAVPLARVVSALDGGEIADRAVAVTFDDGYADNYTAALPVLEPRGVPATVFVTTGFVGQPLEMWWDQLDRILLQPGTIPRLLRLHAAGRFWEWDLGEDDATFSEEDAQRHALWRAGVPAPTRRHAAYRAIWDLLSTLPPRARASAIEQLNECCATDLTARPTHRALTLGELGALGRSPLIEIGAHTVTHSALSRMPAAEQRAEIEESRRRLESLLGRAVTSFAYPFGTREHYTEETVALVRACGLSSACVNVPSLVERDTDPCQVPRRIVPNVDGDGFARLLREWLDE